jgi:hypothetical protein
VQAERLQLHLLHLQPLFLALAVFQEALPAEASAALLQLS